MRFKIKEMDISTGSVLVGLLNKKDASDRELYALDRVLITYKRKKTVIVIDIAEKDETVPRGYMGLFNEARKRLGVRPGAEVKLSLVPHPVSIQYIRKKMDGIPLSEKEYFTIIQDMVDNKLTDIEIATFVTSSYIYNISFNEIVSLTKAMRDTGDILKINKDRVIDLHSIGGVAGNRTTPIVVPILIAAGLIVPKTSSRSITSPAGTADTLEVLTNVSLSLKELKKMISKVGGFMTWGGAVSLAPADDRIIKIEHPLNIDAEGQMLASIVAKKASVSATYVLIDIPVGKGAKVQSRSEGVRLKSKFQRLGERIGLKMDVILTNGSQPIGNGIGPTLEVKDILWVLMNDGRGPLDLKEKSLAMAGRVLEKNGKAYRRQGIKKAREILESGKAYEVFKKIIEMQGGKIVQPNELRFAEHKVIVRSSYGGKVIEIYNPTISKIAKVAGAPKDNEAGVLLHVHVNDMVAPGQPLFTVYSDSRQKLKRAQKIISSSSAVVIG